MDFPIDDARDISFFKISTFSKYQKSAVKQQLLDGLKSGQLEPACHWTTEMVCSGQFIELWELILLFFGKHINLGNPKLALYLDYRFQLFRDAASKTSDDLNLRNCLVIRQLFAEIVAVLCLSVKRPGMDQVKVKKEDLNLASVNGGTFKATNAEFIKPFLKEGDPLDIYAPLNELCFALAGKNTLSACYWIEWVTLYERTKKPAVRCIDRECSPQKKYASDVIWIIWDILVSYAADGLNKKLADATFNLFRLHYTPGANEKRRFLLYFVVLLCCDPFDAGTPMIADKLALETVVAKFNLFYRDIRKRSIRLKTDAD